MKSEERGARSEKERTMRERATGHHPDSLLAPRSSLIVRVDGEHLQRNLVRSHAAGVGPDLPVDAARAMLLLRANALAKGYSGVRPVVVERLLDLLNAGITPCIPAQGSVGASGDLAPLAHIALVLIGEGRAL